MLKYFISLTVAVVMAATVLVAWTPQSLATVETCEQYTRDSTVCTCASKWFGYLRLVECGEPVCMTECTDTWYDCTFENPCRPKEEFVELQSADNQMKLAWEACECPIE